MDDIYNLLSSYLAGNNNEGINENLAQFFLTYLNDVPRMRVSDVASHCHTSEPSVIRFCRKLGYDGYLEFRQTVKEYLENVEDKYLVPKLEINISTDKKQYDESINTWLYSVYTKANVAMTAISREKLKALAIDIRDYKHVFVYAVGLSSLIAERMRIHLARMGKTIITVSGLRMENPIISEREKTLGIIISQHGRIAKSIIGNDDIYKHLEEFCGKNLVGNAIRQKTGDGKRCNSFEIR